ncbi:hypothetical protein BFC23_14100 [Carnobacterium maltaromaticum]|jgi:hypothetical protein|nr:hypothetical protein BFC23_14100 [Carnobacterium maltaromaticum]
MTTFLPKLNNNQTNFLFSFFITTPPKCNGPIDQSQFFELTLIMAVRFKKSTAMTTPFCYLTLHQVAFLFMMFYTLF